MPARQTTSTADLSEPSLDAPPLLTGKEALFLDFDGTLAPFAAVPDAVIIDQALPPLLRAMSDRLGGAIAIMTGRPLAQIDRLLGVRLPGSGVHGLEVHMAHDGPLRFLGPDWPMQPTEAALRRLVAADERLVLEKKPGSLALHYRRAPERGPDLIIRLGALVHGQADLMLMRGHCVLEIKPSGFDKGRALGMLCEVPPWKDRIPVVAGDDVTDEDAFAQAARAHGWGIKVGNGLTKAAFRVQSIHELAVWLRTSLVSIIA